MAVVPPPTLKRVTVVTPRSRVDVSLPVQAPVADVVLQLVALVGLDVDPNGQGEDAAAGGWVLSRLDGGVVDPEQSVGGAGVRDGDLLYLGPRRATVAPAVFDDVVDAVASAAGTRASRWTPDTTRRAGQVGAIALGVAALALVLDAGPPWLLSALAAAGLAGVLLLCAGLASRAGGQRRSGAALAGAAVVYATAAGLVAGGGERELVDFEAPHLLLACVGLLLAAVAGQVVVACYTPAFVGAGTVGILGALIVGGGVATGVSAATTAGIALVVLLVFSTTLPGTALRLAKLPFPHVPADPAEFRQGESPTLDSDVLDETRKADEFLTGLLVAVSIAATLCALTLAVSGGAWRWSLAATTGLVFLMRSRHLRHTGQRVAIMVGGFAALLVVLVPLFHSMAPLVQLVVAAGVVGVGVPLLTVALRKPVKSLSPYWGRALDVTEIVGAIVLLPLLAASLGLFGRMLGLGG